jgi:uncharacterized protein involved in exopolysaccharide biosynthesis
MHLQQATSPAPRAGYPAPSHGLPLTAQLRRRAQTLRRHWKSLAALGGGILVTAVAAAVAWPATYRSSGTILIEQQEVPEEFVRSAISSYADQRVQVISQRVMTSANLLDVINKYNLYTKQRLTRSRESIIQDMREDIALKMISADVVDPRQGRATKATIAFAVSFDGSTPQLAAAVANELTTLFLRENVDMRKQQAAGTAEFLSTEAQRIGNEVEETEKRLATFKMQNEGNLPEMAQLNLQLAARAQDDLRELDSRIRSLDQQIVFLNAQLAQISPTSSLYKDGSERVLSSNDQLRVLRTQYATAKAKYSPDHPDVLRLQKEIEGLENALGKTPAYRDAIRDLEARRTELARLRETRTADHPDVIRLQREVDALEKQARIAGAATTAASAGEEPDNPAYIQIKASLTAAQSDRASVSTQRAQVATRLAMLESRSQTGPGVERDYSELVRNLDNARKKYAEVQQKQMEAQLSSNLETERKGERFTLIEPAVEPQRPVRPNRPLIALLGFLLAAGAVIGAVLLIEALDNRIHSREDIANLVQVPPLAVIPWVDGGGKSLETARG